MSPPKRNNSIWIKIWKIYENLRRDPPSSGLARPPGLFHKSQNLILSTQQKCCGQHIPWWDVLKNSAACWVQKNEQNRRNWNSPVGSGPLPLPIFKGQTSPPQHSFQCLWVTPCSSAGFWWSLLRSSGVAKFGYCRSKLQLVIFVYFCKHQDKVSFPFWTPHMHPSQSSEGLPI